MPTSQAQEAENAKALEEESRDPDAAADQANEERSPPVDSGEA